MLPFVLCAFFAFIALPTPATPSSSSGILAPGNMIAERPAPALWQCFEKFGNGYDFRQDEEIVGVVQEWVACQLLEYISLMQEITYIALRSAAATITSKDLRNLQCVAGLIFFLSQNVNSGLSWEGDHLYNHKEIVELCESMCLNGGCVCYGIPDVPDELTDEKIVRYVLNTFAADRSPFLATAHAATNVKEQGAQQTVVLWNDDRPGTGLYDVKVNRAWFRLVHMLRNLVFYVWKEIAPGGDDAFNRHGLAKSVQKATLFLMRLIANVESGGPDFLRNAGVTMPCKLLADLRTVVEMFANEKKREASWLDTLETSASKRYKIDMQVR